jgi:ribA/ribD-fused uncharacterized protein
MSKELNMYCTKEKMEDGSVRKTIGFVGYWLSNFFLMPFFIDGVKFNCVEQFFHWKKAVHFGDKETADLILAEENPKEQKKLGRAVKNFNPKIWEDISYDVMLQGLYAKFSVEGMKYVLLDTGDAFIREDAPYDEFWGTGLSCDEALKGEKVARGKNNLGKALMETRRKIREEMGLA